RASGSRDPGTNSESVDRQAWRVKKLWGRLIASPVGFCLEVSYFFFFFAFFLAAMVLFSLPLFMESCNDRLLHASFVEPLKSEVKRKIVFVCCRSRNWWWSNSESRSRRQLHCQLKDYSAEQ